MDILFEIEKLNEWKDHLKLLNTTKSKQPYNLLKATEHWKNKILIKEDLIVKNIKKLPILAI